MGHPVLRQRAAEIADPTAPEIRALVDDMVETLADAVGIGLAAPQVFVPRRLVIIKIPAERAADEGDEGDEGDEDAATPLTAMVNPVIEPLSDAQNLRWEACLSLPGMAGEVPRYDDIRYRYQTLAGAVVTAAARGFPARVIQHECDHLDGVLYPMRIKDMANFGFVEELHRAERIGTQAQEARAAEQQEAIND